MNGILWDCLSELRSCDINRMKKSECVELLVLAKLRGCYKEDEDRRICTLKLDELRADLRQVVVDICNGM